MVLTTGKASNLRSLIDPGAVKLGRKPIATSQRHLSTYQWNQLLLQRASAPTLNVLFLQTNRVWLWKEGETRSRKPSWAASTGCKIYLKSVSMETHRRVRGPSLLSLTPLTVTTLHIIHPADHFHYFNPFSWEWNGLYIFYVIHSMTSCLL